MSFLEKSRKASWFEDWMKCGSVGYLGSAPRVVNGAGEEDPPLSIDDDGFVIVSHGGSGWENPREEEKQGQHFEFGSTDMSHLNLPTATPWVALPLIRCRDRRQPFVLIPRFLHAALSAAKWSLIQNPLFGSVINLVSSLDMERKSSRMQLPLYGLVSKPRLLGCNPLTETNTLRSRPLTCPEHEVL